MLLVPTDFNLIKRGSGIAMLDVLVLAIGEKELQETLDLLKYDQIAPHTAQNLVTARGTFEGQGEGIEPGGLIKMELLSWGLRLGRDRDCSDECLSTEAVRRAHPITHISPLPELPGIAGAFDKDGDLLKELTDPVRQGLLPGGRRTRKRFPRPAGCDTRHPHP